jgi:protein-S-isoprenylcysteine O-methyltransferase Ste14
MKQKPAKAKGWKRVVVLLLGLFAVGVSVALFFVASETTPIVAKWVILPLIFVGGAWLIFASIRGRATDVDATADGFIFRR